MFSHINYSTTFKFGTLPKKAMGLTADKGGSRRLATERFPDCAALFARVKDDGRAEAALIAAWGAQ